jgi:hypothetical protein
MSRSNLRLAIIILTLLTAAIHVYLNFNTGTFSFQPVFTLNALGYLALLALFFKWIDVPFLRGREKLLWYAFMGYTALTLVAYFAVNGAAGFANPVGLIDKVVELFLLIALWLHKEN